MGAGGTAGISSGGGPSAGASQGGSAGAHAGAGGQASGGGSNAGAAGQGATGAFALTSSKLSASMAFPADFTCAGADHSPPFSWGPGPSTTTLTTPAGAKQKAYSGNGYMGPCPSGMVHTYTFTLYALDVATLPGVMASTATAGLVTAIQMHDVASATLSATSDAKKP